MKSATLYNILLAIAAALTLTSCHHKNLCYDHPHTRTLRLEFDWRDAPDANPEGMCVYFYPLSGESAPMRRFDFAGTKGGEITIEDGRYRVICYNNDTEAVQFRGVNAFDSHEAFTRNGNIFEPLYGNGASYAPRAEGADDERVVICPDMLWGDHAVDVVINERGISYTSAYDVTSRAASAGFPVKDSQVITMFPHELVCHYSYEVRHVKNITSASQMCATLSSMSPSIYLGTETLDPEPVTIPFAAKSDGQSTITGKFLTFGDSEENKKPHKFVLYVWFIDGSKYYYTFDVTNQIHSAPDKRHVHLIIDGLDFPQPITNGNGFHPSVDDWYEVKEDIIM